MVKKFRKKLKNRFKSTSTREYSIIGGIRDWLEQCGIKPSDKNLMKVLSLNDGFIFYPYQEADRKKVLNRLKKKILKRQVHE